VRIPAVEDVVDHGVAPDDPFTLSVKRRAAQVEVGTGNLFVATTQADASPRRRVAGRREPAGTGVRAVSPSPSTPVSATPVTSQALSRDRLLTHPARWTDAVITIERRVKS
jgi:hypothetical protein